MLRLLQTAVWAALTTLAITSSVAALAPKTALRASDHFSLTRVTAANAEARGTHQQNTLRYGESASDSSLASVFFKNGQFAGKSIGEVVAGLRSGAINPSQLPIDVIVRNGQTLALNTRSSLALTRAGIDPSKWTMVNRTGDAFFEKLLTERLARNGLTEAGTEVLRITGMGQNASAIW